MATGPVWDFTLRVGRRARVLYRQRAPWGARGARVGEAGGWASGGAEGGTWGPAVR